MLKASHKIFLHKLKWYIFEKISIFFDFFLYYIKYNNKDIKDIKKNELKKIVFLGEMLPPRIPRIAKWVKRSNKYSVILICHKRGFFEKFSNTSFDSIFLYRNKWHLKRIINFIPNISIIHGFAPKSYYCNIIRKFVNCPYIQDMQDVYAIYYGLTPTLKWLQNELPHEKECLENADGIVAHSFEPNVALRKYGTKKKPKTLFFPLYCDEDVCTEPLNKELNLQEIHFVYAGGVAGSQRDPKQYGNIQFHGIIKNLSNQKIHFHIYPSPSSYKADYEEYKIIAEKNPLFHLHAPVSQENLADELRKYHFGFHTGFVNQEEHTQSKDKYKYCTTLKLFNFIEAGIPIIISNNLFYQSWLIERFKLGYVINRDDLNNIVQKITEKNYYEITKHIKEIRTKISIGSNINRLISFYNSIEITNFKTK